MMAAMIFFLVLLTVIDLLLVAFGISFLLGGIMGLPLNRRDGLASIAVGSAALAGAVVAGIILVRLASGIGSAALQGAG